MVHLILERLLQRDEAIAAAHEHLGHQREAVRVQGVGVQGAQPAAVDPSRPQRLEIKAGTTARYKVREQLAGVAFPSDAVGTTQA